MLLNKTGIQKRKENVPGSKQKIKTVISQHSKNSIEGGL